MILCVYTAEPRFPASDQHPQAHRVEIGDVFADYLGDTPSTADLAAFRKAATVPGSVTPLQARRALRAAGLLDTVNAWVEQQNDPDVKDAWEFALIIERHGPITEAASVQLGLTEAQLDDLFIAAAAL